MTPFPLSFLQLIFIIRQSSQNGKIDVIHPIITGLPVRPSHKMGFRSSVSKRGLPGEGRHEGLVPRNDVVTNGFIWVSSCTEPCTDTFCTLFIYIILKPSIFYLLGASQCQSSNNIINLRSECVKKAKSVLWEAEKMADKGKEISRLWISDWKKYARRHKKSHLKNEN